MKMEDSWDLCFKTSPLEMKPLFDEAFRLSRAHFSNRIYFYAPGMLHFDTSFYKATNPHRFPSISVTGRKCHLNCEHCRGKLLEAMIPATTPKKLLDVCTKIVEGGGRGCLISGGSEEDGSVPLMDFVPTIRRIKHELGLDVVVHTGIVSPDLARALAEAEIDAAMIDIIGSNETIGGVYHLDLTVDDFDRSLSLLEQYRVPVVPHVLVGIHYAKIRGERRALQVISEHRPAALVVIALMPLDQTAMEHLKPPTPLNIARVILVSRLMMPDIPLILGCARPRGGHKSQTDILAIKAGVSGIAYPSEEGYDFARKAGLDINFSEECCSLAYRDLAAPLKKL